MIVFPPASLSDQLAALYPVLSSGVRAILRVADDDVVQDAAFYLYRHWHQYDSTRGTLEAYATQIAKSMAMNARRKARRREGIAPMLRITDAMAEAVV